jgi:hypothetical protein
MNGINEMNMLSPQEQQELLARIKDQEAKVAAREAMSSSDAKVVSLTSEIAQLQEQLNMGKITQPSLMTSQKDFLNEYGEETWYVRNKSNKHIVLDFDKGDKIPRSECIDLTQFASVEEIKKSPALRKCLKETGDLERITPAAYVQFLKDRIEKERQQRVYEKSIETTSKPINKGVRPVIHDKLNKLKLFLKGDTLEIKALGITPIAFIEWLNSEELSEAELDIIMGMADDSMVRSKVIEKKQSMLR